MSADPGAKSGGIGGALSVLAFGLLVLFGSWAAGFDAARYLELDESGVRVDANVKSTRTFDTGHGSSRSPVYVAEVEFTTLGDRVINGEATIDEEVYERLRGKDGAKLRVVYLVEEPEGFRHEELTPKKAARHGSCLG